MAIINMLPHAGGGTPTVLHTASGRNITVSYTFTEAHKTVIITGGGCYNFTMNSDGWTQIGYSASDIQRAYAWQKDDVASGETVSVKTGDRAGLVILGID